MPQRHALDPQPGGVPAVRPRRARAVFAVLTAAGIGTAACAAAVGTARPARAPARLLASTHPPATSASVLTGAPDVVAAAAAADLFATAPVVVLASPGSTTALAAAVGWAERAHAPLLLTGPGRPRATATVRADISALHPRVVLVAGLAAGALSGLPGVRVITSPARLPVLRAPAPLRQVVLLVQRDEHGPAATAAIATAHAAGAQVLMTSGYDPRADPAAIAALAAGRPQQVIAVGIRFGPVRQLTARIAVAETGVQLPGGGQVLFPGHRLVALYGHPGTPGLGALGQQSLSASVTRARRLAARYRRFSHGLRVVPTFEIIATVAQASPGADGSYSYVTPVSLLRPWVKKATAAGLYVVLDLQPGRASFLTQARHYRSLLKLPDVGLALDPEWKLQPGQLPLQQIGSVHISEVNSVIRWLAALTARYHLPQKLLVLHQFRLSMILGERHLDTTHDDLAIVIHMDGQGTPGEKLQTWASVTAAAPKGVHFGWKNFYLKDHPMMTPGQTMQRRPEPVMISYQ